MRAEVVDLFCGIGGLSAGFKNEGFRVLAGFDSDKTCKFAYEHNVKASFVPADVAALPPEAITKLYSKKARRILVGCAPCQPFSLYTGRYRRAPKPENGDQRWQLLEAFARLIEAVRPDVVSMENVPRVVLHPVFAQFVERLRKAGYVVGYHKVRAEEYGVPQRRGRLVLFASLHGEVELSPPTHRGRLKTVRDAIGGLPPIGAGEAHHSDRVHACRGLGVKNLRRLQATSEGGGWQEWAPDLVLDCHKKEGGRSFRSVYGRMRWDEPAPVITTQCLGIGNGRFGHPHQDRAISIREAALLQSFPPDFEFVDPEEDVFGERLARQIGNAVPVRLAEAVARSIRAHLAYSVDGAGSATRR